ncbi:MAG TPA: sigma 54-interacting transcriptional regulator, partial [Anaeromyxobacteraceae bacterium]
MAELAFFRHGEELLRVTLGERTSLGRSPGCDVSLPDGAVSRVHAVVERRADGFWLVDRSAGAAEGSDPAESRLADGGEFALGPFRALFREAPPEEAGETRSGGATAVHPRRSEPPVQPARLRVREKGRERVLNLPEALVLGKDPACDVALDDGFVSARHLRVERRGGRFHLRDLGSTNGTFLGGARVVDTEWIPGTTATLGETEVVLEAGDPSPPPSTFEGMLSGDAAMRQVFELLERVAPSDAPVAVLGETGTGKELVARALHRMSGRREGAFIPVNCSAIAATLIESELFGHEKGAFSGADRLRKGAFEEADGGTLFLDEIGELPLDLQPKLLRALEQGEVKRVGATRPFHVNVRVVAATHRDLRARVRAGRFREDLYYRLFVVPVTIPPLRRRRGDVAALADHFLSRGAPRGLPLRWSDEARARLEAYDWPGNVRQLRNVVQRALLFRGEGLEVPPSAVVLEDVRDAPGAGSDDDTLFLRGLTMEEVERETIRLSLRRHRGKRAAVVRELRIAKSTVMKRIAQWGLQGE